MIIFLVRWGWGLPFFVLEMMNISSHLFIFIPRRIQHTIPPRLGWGEKLHANDRRGHSSSIEYYSCPPRIPRRLPLPQASLQRCLDGRSTSVADNSAYYWVSLICCTSIEIHTSTQPLMYLLQIHSRRHGGGGFDKNTVRGRGLSLVGVSGRRGGAVRWSLISLDPQYINQFTSVG